MRRILLCYQASALLLVGLLLAASGAPARAQTVVGTMSVGTDPFGVRINPTTKRIYVANRGSNDVSLIEDLVSSSPVPNAVSTWYFAEGSTQPPFDTWFLVQNPSLVLAHVRFTFQLPGGGEVIRDVVVGATSRFSLFANPELPNTAFSTRIDADQPVFAERSMFVGFDGDVATGIASPNVLWLFAEGSTQNPFHTWFLLQNPSAREAKATITYLRLGGSPSLTQRLSLPADGARLHPPDVGGNPRLREALPQRTGAGDRARLGRDLIAPRAPIRSRIGGPRRSPGARQGTQSARGCSHRL